MEVEFIRIILAFICGYFISLSGSLTQITANNPLASPSTLGFNGLAVFLILIAQMLQVKFQFEIPFVYIALFLFSIVLIGFALFSFRKTKKRGDSIWSLSSTQNIVLIGLSFNLLIGAIFSVIQFVFISFNFEFPTGIWFGSLKQYSDTDLYIFVPLFIMVFICIYRKSRTFELLNLGSPFAMGLGLNIRSAQRMALLISLLLTGVITIFYGVFSFMGLVFPQIIRSLPFWKSNIRGELVQGAVLMGFIFIGLDQMCYFFTILGAEIPVGMVSSVIGSIILIVMVYLSSRKMR